MALQPKHLKALGLIEENILSLQEIAKASNISYSYLRKLVEGTADAGNMGQLFHSEVNKIYKRIDHRNKKRVRQTKDLLLKRLEKWSRELPPSKLKDPQVRRILEALNTLSKATPQMEVNAYTQIYSSMTPEDLANEFRKLKTLAQLALDGTGVPGVGSGKSGEISRLIKSGGTVPKKQEDPLLRPPSEAGDFPQGSDPDQGDIRGK